MTLYNLFFSDYRFQVELLYFKQPETENSENVRV